MLPNETLFARVRSEQVFPIFLAESFYKALVHYFIFRVEQQSRKAAPRNTTQHENFAKTWKGVK